MLGISEKAALLIIDVQNDFCPGGSLGVKDGDAIIPVINRLLALREGNHHFLVIASRDWHPQGTRHFEKWPQHCIAGTRGAEFHPDLKLPADTIIVSKGQTEISDGYSAFDGGTADGRSLEQVLDDRNIEVLYIVGLATDYCVKETVIDSRAQKYARNVYLGAIRAVDMVPGDGQRAIDAMLASGANM